MRLKKFLLHFLVVFIPVSLLFLFSVYRFEILEPFGNVQYSVAQGFKLGHKGRLSGYKYWYQVNGTKYNSIVAFGYNPFTNRRVSKYSIDKDGKYLVKFSSAYERSGKVLLNCQLNDSVQTPEIPWDTIPTSLLKNRVPDSVDLQVQ